MFLARNVLKIVTALSSTMLYCIAAHAASCASGIETNFSMRVQPGNSSQVQAFSGGTPCGPYSDSLTRTADGGIGTVSLIAGSIGAAAAAGAISANPFQLAWANATAFTYIEFVINKIDPLAPDFVFQPVGYEVEVVTVSTNVGISGSGSSTLEGDATVNFFSIGDAGEMNLAGGVPFEHRSGVPVSLTPGAVARFGDDSVNVEVGRLHKAAFGVTAFAQASAGDGSASAEISLAISGIVTPPPGYSILFSGSAPAFGAYPNIDAPLSTIPIPAAVWLFVPALMSLRLFRRTKTDA